VYAADSIRGDHLGISPHMIMRQRDFQVSTWTRERKQDKSPVIEILTSRVQLLLMLLPGRQRPVAIQPTHAAYHGPYLV
jgi:hypothetical protein